MLKEKSLIRLSDNKDYVVVKQINYKNGIYYVLSNFSKIEDIKFVKMKEMNGKVGFLIINDEALIKNLVLSLG